MTTALTLSCQPNQDLSQSQDIIRAVYRQVFGNKHLMELDRIPSIEALFMNGDLTIQGLITALGQSETYRRLFFEKSSPYRFVELNYKHFLGRPPRNQAEISKHISILADEGFEAEIASYTYSEEYLKSFGINTVPYIRTNETIAGEVSITFNRTKRIDPGYAGYDSEQNSILLNSIASNNNPASTGMRKLVGGGGMFNIKWTSKMQPGVNRKSVQRSVASYNSLSRAIQGIQAQGGNIIEIISN